MPLYEYACDRCGHRFEKIQKFSDPLVDVCPKCGVPVHKLVSSPAFQFKGSGWYITDYGKKDGGDKGTKAGGSDAKDTKPAADAPKESGSSDSAKESKSSSTEASSKPAETKSS